LALQTRERKKQRCQCLGPCHNDEKLPNNRRGPREETNKADGCALGHLHALTKRQREKFRLPTHTNGRQMQRTTRRQEHHPKQQQRQQASEKQKRKRTTLVCRNGNRQRQHANLQAKMRRKRTQPLKQRYKGKKTL